MAMAARAPAGSLRTGAASLSSAAVVAPADAVMSSPNGWLVHVSARRGAAVTRSRGGRFPPPIAMLPATQGDHHTCPPTGDPQDRPAARGTAEEPGRSAG